MRFQTGMIDLSPDKQLLNELLSTAGDLSAQVRIGRTTGHLDAAQMSHWVLF
jgi:hypothetical protein